MIQSASHLASLIGSRICHDLISPIGAIHNGLELISLSGPVQHEAEISLITQSCQNAASRIKFFRVAFGASGSDRQLSTDTLLDILMPLINGPRQNLHWKIHRSLTRREAQALFLAILCIETALPLGGEISVTERGPRLSVEGCSTKIIVDATIWDPLTNTGPKHASLPEHVQFLFLPSIVHEIGRELNVCVQPSLITINLSA